MLFVFCNPLRGGFLLEKMKEFGTRHHEFRRTRRTSAHRVVVVEAHNDDAKMANIESTLAKKGVHVTRITLTDGGGRNLPLYGSNLPDVRWKEGIVSGDITHIADTHRIDTPDGSLSRHIAVATDFAREYTAGATAIIAPHPEDEHADHRAAYEVAMRLGENTTPVYAMDTISGLSRTGELLVPELYIPLSRRAARREIRSYRAHASQTRDLPHGEIGAVFDVIAMTKRRGRERDIEHAAVLFSAHNTEKSPLEEILVYQR